MNTGDQAPASPLLQVLDLLESLGLRYHLGGSYASSFHGVPRHTHDADLVVELDERAVGALAESLASDFYLDENRMRQAVARRSSFNMIHLATGFKVDVFVKGREPFDDRELARSELAELPEMGGRTIRVKSAEDIVLRKLRWYDEGGRTSDRQWTDVLGVIKAQGDRLDREYLARWSEELGVRELLDRALTER